MNRTISDETRAEVERLLDTGMSNLAIARQLTERGTRISEGSVRLIKKTRNVVKASAPERSVPARVEPEPEPVSEPAPEADETLTRALSSSAGQSTLQRTRALFEKATRLVEKAEKDGNHTAAQRAMRDCGQYAILIARLEKAEAETKDTIALSKEDIDRGLKGLSDKLQTLASVPLTCSECGRALRIKATKGE